MLHNTRVSIYVYITSVFLNKYSIFMHTEGVNYLIAFKKIHLKIKTWMLQCSFLSCGVHLREYSRRLKFCCDTGAYISFYCDMCQRLPASVLSLIFQKN